MIYDCLIIVTHAVCLQLQLRIWIRPQASMRDMPSITSDRAYSFPHYIFLNDVQSYRHLPTVCESTSPETITITISITVQWIFRSSTHYHYFYCTPMYPCVHILHPRFESAKKFKNYSHSVEKNFDLYSNYYLPINYVLRSGHQIKHRFGLSCAIGVVWCLANGQWIFIWIDINKIKF